tara:strand:- start:16379 stop:16714 length:336 start_codon:yes stop_codon:yes gene_type:complete
MKRQLAQARPTDTAAVSVWTPTEAAPYRIVLVSICNVTTSSVDVSLFHDVDGTTYDESTALVWKHTLVAGEILCYESEISDYRAAGNLAVQSSVSNAATFSVYGEIQGERV